MLSFVLKVIGILITFQTKSLFSFSIQILACYTPSTTTRQSLYHDIVFRTSGSSDPMFGLPIRLKRETSSPTLVLITEDLILNKVFSFSENLKVN